MSQTGLTRWALARKSVVVLMALAFLAACDRSNPTEPEGPSLAEVQDQVFSQSCVGCHGGSGPAAGLNLEEANAFDNIVNVPSSQVPSLLRVEPGNADDSYLLVKITGSERMAPGTFQMPIGQELSSEHIGLVRRWIDGGAER